MHLLAPTIHEGFDCNLGDAAATSLTATGLTARPVNILFRICLLPAHLRAHASRGVSAGSLRIPVNNAG
jgi:hypothetical protein